MIIEPDFLDHWKTKLLADLMGDPCAPLYLIRLWAHCQNRKSDRFSNMTPEVMKSICHYSGDAGFLWDKLTETQWIAKGNPSGVVVLGFRDVNQKLFSSWENGARGGRPRKKNPTETQPKPKNNPRVTDREDREDKPSPLTPQGAEGEVEAEVSRRGVVLSARAVQAARAAGCGLDQIRRVLEHYDSKPGAWDAGALYERLCHLCPEQLVEQGWPDPSPGYYLEERQRERTEKYSREQQRREQEQAERETRRRHEAQLEARHGAAVDAMERPEAERILRERLGTDAAAPFLKSWKRGERVAGIARWTLIEELEGCHV